MPSPSKSRKQIDEKTLRYKTRDNGKKLLAIGRKAHEFF